MITVYRRTITDESILKADSFEVGTWINVINPTQREITSLCDHLRLDSSVIKPAFDENEKPHIDFEGRHVIIIIRVPLTDNGIITVIPLMIIIGEKNIVTISLKETDVLADFVNQQVRDFYTTKKTRFVLQILSRTNYYFKKILDQMEKKIENIEQSLIQHLRNKEILELLGMQKSLVYINTAVIANEKVFERISHGKVIKLFEQDAGLLENIIIENKESMEMVNIYTNILANTTDAYSSIISNNLNNVMKFLTSITIILAIPTIVASFYGMNVSLPFQESSFAFIYVILITAFIAVTATLFFIKMKYF